VLSNYGNSCSVYTSCTEKFCALQFDPAVLELATLPLPTMSVSVRPFFPNLVKFSKFCRFTPSRVQKSLQAFVTPLNPHYLPPFPMDINYAFKSDNRQDRFEKISFNNQKAKGHLPLKCIDRRILWDLVISFACILNLQKKNIGSFSFLKISS
jgi:hypothetical protein